MLSFPASIVFIESVRDIAGEIGKEDLLVAVPSTVTAESVGVSAQLYYQAIPPYYLRQRFEQAPNGEGTQRLYFMTSTLDNTKTPFAGWKLLVAQGASD